MSVKPGFTVGDGWARGFSLEQTADWTGLSIDKVMELYIAMDMDYDNHLQSTQLQVSEPCSALLT